MKVFFCTNGGWEVWVKVFFVQMVSTNHGKYKCEWNEKLIFLNTKWLEFKMGELKMAAIFKLELRMNEFEAEWISLSQSQSGRESVFESIWEKKARCLNSTDGGG